MGVRRYTLDRNIGSVKNQDQHARCFANDVPIFFLKEQGLSVGGMTIREVGGKPYAAAIVSICAAARGHDIVVTLNITTILPVLLKKANVNTFLLHL